MENSDHSESLVAVCLALSLALAFAAPSSAAPGRCEPDENRATLTGWVGEWQVVVDDLVVGQVQMSSILGGCAFEQVRQRADGAEEIGLIYRDPVTGRWEQRWVSSVGDTGSFELSFELDAVTMSGEMHTGEGARAQVRVRVRPRVGGGFVEELELSDDGGDTYHAPVVTTYLPPHETVTAEPSPSVTPASAPSEPEAEEPRPARAVTERSRRKADAPLPATSMESPMTLEFELGPLVDMPPGSSWRTVELAPYSVERVSIPTVTAAHRVRRGAAVLELTVNLLTRAVKAKVDLEAELLSDGESVARGQALKIALGRLIKSHDSKTGRPSTLRLEVDNETFVDLFAGGRRPTVRLTVTVY
jgi:hypothetical protein